MTNGTTPGGEPGGQWMPTTRQGWRALQGAMYLGIVVCVPQAVNGTRAFLVSLLLTFAVSWACWRPEQSTDQEDWPRVPSALPGIASWSLIVLAGWLLST